MIAHAVGARVSIRDRVFEQPVLDGSSSQRCLPSRSTSSSGSSPGSLTLSDVLTSVFLVVFVWDRFERGDMRLTRTAVIAFVFFLVFALVYLAGFYALDTSQALAQWAKGMVKFVLHFGFLVTGVALLARRSLSFYWLALAAFLGGIALNALYGVIQLYACGARGREPRRRPDRAHHLAADRDQRVRGSRRDAGCSGRTR